MEITPDSILMEGETVLTQYILTYWKLDYVNSSKYNFSKVVNYKHLDILLALPEAGVSIMIVLKRRIMNEILTTYLPSVLILIIVYVTNYFKPFFFEAVVTVNLTSLLVLTTLFISVSGHNSQQLDTL